MLSEKDLSKNQAAAVQFIDEGSDTLLLADIGVGKTIIILTALQHAFERKQAKRVLVVAPLRVARWTWPKEVEKWAHTKDLSVAVACGRPGRSMPAKKRRAAIDSGAQVTTINYAGLTWLLDQYPVVHHKNGTTSFPNGPFPFDVVVYDEIDKMSRTSKRTKKMKRYTRFVEIRIGATGTLTPNTLMEVYAATQLIDNGATFKEPFEKWKRKYFFQEDFHGYVWKPFPHMVDKLYARLEPLVFRIALEDEQDTPPIREVIVDVELNKEAQAAYDDMFKKFIAFLKEEKREVVALNAATKSQKLTQLASGFLYSKEDEADKHNQTTWLDKAKFDALDEIVSEMQGKQLIVVYHFKAQRDELLRRYKKRIWELDDDTIDRWNKGEGELLMFHAASASHGLNLHEGKCHHLVYLISPWSGGQDDQVIGRIRRRGQEKRVAVMRLTAKNTIDEHIIDVLHGKKRNMWALLDAMLAATEARQICE